MNKTKSADTKKKAAIAKVAAIDKCEDFPVFFHKAKFATIFGKQ